MSEAIPHLTDCASHWDGECNCPRTWPEFADALEKAFNARINEVLRLRDEARAERDEARAEVKRLKQNPGLATEGEVHAAGLLIQEMCRLQRERDEAIAHRDDYETRCIEQSIAIRSLRTEMERLREKGSGVSTPSITTPGETPARE